MCILLLLLQHLCDTEGNGRCFSPAAFEAFLLAMGNSAPAARAAIGKGAKLPGSVTLDKGFPPSKVPLKELIGGKKVVMVGLPGAFTPT